MSTKGKSVYTAAITNRGMLRSFGYSTKKSTNSRHAALNKAISHYGEKDVVQHLNLIRNKTADMNTKNIMSEDIEFLKTKSCTYLSKTSRSLPSRCASLKLSRSRSKTRTRSRSRSKSRSKSRSMARK